MTAVLYIVATPIGNLQDMTQRGLAVLSAVGLIAAEDTRHSKRLLQHYGVKTKCISLHQHNEQARTEQLLKYLQEGIDVALISDAGTPLISDPGSQLVAAVRAANIRIVPIPGACAAITALCAAGLPTDRFVFEGFLPAKNQQCRQRLEELKTETRTLVIYEAPHRILGLIEAMLEIFGADRFVVLARELTKTFETIHGAPLVELKQWLLSDANQTRGEFVVLVHGAAPAAETAISHDALNLLKILLTELPLKQAVSLAAKISGAKKNLLYQLALDVNHQQ